MSETRLTKQEFNAVLQCLLDVSATVGKWHEPIDKKICDRLNAAVSLMVEAHKRPAEPPLPCEEVEQRLAAMGHGELCDGDSYWELAQDTFALIRSLKQEVARLTDGLKFIRDCEDDGEEMGPLVTVGFLKEQARTLLGKEEPSAD